MFIDEGRTLIGAGGVRQNDALTCSSLHWRAARYARSPRPRSEYKKYFEGSALTRRFRWSRSTSGRRQGVVLRGVGQAMAAHHKVRILDGRSPGIKLSSRFIPGRQLRTRR
jgi:type VI secretion system protein VasG